MQIKHWKRAIAATLASLAGTTAGTPILLGQTAGSPLSIPAGLQNVSSANSSPIQYLPFAHFNIPFEIDASSPLPREVHLWVSPDQGRSWLKYASTTPDKRSFEFHAAAEGEYLFAVQTRDGQGDSALAAAPPMRIMIDTTRPELQLSVDVSTAGRLIIDYQISDAFLVEDSVRLAYCPDGQAKWEDIPTGNLVKTGNAWSGRCEIDMPRCRELDVRITSSDLAQNQAERTFHFSAPRTAAANSGMQLASQRGDAQANDPNSWVAAAPTKPPLHSAQRYPQTGISSRNPVAMPTGPAQASGGLVASQGGVAWNPSNLASQRSMSGWTAGPARATAAHTVAAQPGSDQSAQSGDGVRLSAVPALGYEELPPPNAIEDSSSDPSYGSELKLGNSVPASSTAKESPIGQQIPVARREVANIELGNAAPPASVAPSLSIERPADSAVSAMAPNDLAPSSLSPKASAATQLADDSLSSAAGIAASPQPTGSNDAYHSRSRAFSLDYAVDSLRGAAVSDIELWGTEDRGETWQKWGSDPDRQSPFDVQVGNDGLFGFRMVIIGANGLISNRPQSGDPADMWIHVDTQMPSVNITRALYGEGDQAGMLVIEFNGADDNMHERPVTLSYSERPTGPWATIASGLSSSGKYYWKPDPNLPQQVFLRAQAVDRAGNTHEHRLELPVSLRGLTPQGRIQGFRPIDAR